MMVYSRNTDHKYKVLKKTKKKKMIPGVARAGLEGFRGTLENRGRVGRAGRSRLREEGSGATDDREVILRSIILR